MNVAQYLEFEEQSSVRHEYVRGLVLAMTGARLAHNIICGNLFSKIHQFLEDGPCRAFINDMKVHAEAADCFYYPDIMVVCEPLDTDSLYVSNPVVLIEVLSPSTQQIDRREKRSAYQLIRSLQQYIVVYQKRMQIDVYRRLSDVDWEKMSLHKTADLEIIICDQTLRLAVESIYKGVDFTPSVKETDDEEDYYGLD